jgi:hypothetical protein
MARPMPIPSALVVKKPSKMRSRYSAGTPGPLSWTQKVTAPSARTLVASSRRLRPLLLAIAWMPLTSRLTITCWSWTRSPSTGGRSRASRTDRSIARDSISWRRNSNASSTTGLRSSGVRSGACCEAMPRTRWTISLARRAFSTMRPVSWPTLARLGSSRDSQRRLVSALVTMAERGWLTSCAIDVASSPSIEIPRGAAEIGLELAELRFGAQAIGDVIDAEDRHVEPLGRHRIGDRQLDIAHPPVEGPQLHHLHIGAHAVEMGGDHALGGVGRGIEQIADRTEQLARAIGREQPLGVVIGVGYMDDAARMERHLRMFIEIADDIGHALAPQPFEDMRNRRRIDLEQCHRQMVHQVAVAILGRAHFPEAAIVGDGAADRYEHDIGMGLARRYLDQAGREGERARVQPPRRAGGMIRHAGDDQRGERGPALGGPPFGDRLAEQAVAPTIGADQVDDIVIDIGDLDSGEQHINPIICRIPGRDRGDRRARQRDVECPPGGGRIVGIRLQQSGARSLAGGGGGRHFSQARPLARRATLRRRPAW